MVDQASNSYKENESRKSPSTSEAISPQESQNTSPSQFTLTASTTTYLYTANRQRQPPKHLQKMGSSSSKPEYIEVNNYPDHSNNMNNTYSNYPIVNLPQTMPQQPEERRRFRDSRFVDFLEEICLCCWFENT